MTRIKSYIFILMTAFFLMATSCSSSAKDKTETTDTTVDTTAQNIIDTPVSSDGLPLIVDFAATWCPPCQKLKPYFHSLSEEYAGKVKMVSIDVDENKELAAKYEVSSIPTLLYFDASGNLVDTTVGLIPEEELRQKIESLITPAH